MTDYAKNMSAPADGHNTVSDDQHGCPSNGVSLSTDDDHAVHDTSAANDSDSLVNAKPKPSIFYFANGFVRYQQSDPVVSEEGKKTQNASVFLLFNNRMARPIQLYSKQMLQLVQRLPEAYLAMQEGNMPYSVVIAINKGQRITLDISDYNEKYYVFLNKCFKPPDKTEDPEQDWLYTKSGVLFDPDQDDAMKLMDFVQACYD